MGLRYDVWVRSGPGWTGDEWYEDTKIFIYYCSLLRIRYCTFVLLKTLCLIRVKKLFMYKYTR